MRKLLSSDHEVLGQAVIGYRDAIESENFIGFFEKHGLHHIEAEKWYPGQNILDVFNEIETNSGQMMNLVSIGMSIGANTLLPPLPAEATFADIIKSVSQGYELVNRGTDIGYITVVQVDDQHFSARVRTPWHDDLWYGILYGYIKRVTDDQIPFILEYDEDAPRMDDGGHETVMVISLG